MGRRNKQIKMAQNMAPLQEYFAQMAQKKSKKKSKVPVEMFAQFSQMFESAQDAEQTPETKSISTKDEHGNKLKIGNYDTNEQPEQQLDEAKQLHMGAVDGDKNAVKKAHEILSNLAGILPQSSVVQAYLGSVTTLLGRDAVNPNERFKFSMSGLKLLDKAVADDPDNIEIRTLRGKVCYRLPEMYFHRTETAIEDFQYLISRYEENNGIFSSEFYNQLLYDLGTAYKNIGQQEEAEGIWSKLSSMKTDMKYKILVHNEGIEVPEFKEQPNKKVWKPADKNELQEGISLYHEGLRGNSEAAQKAYQFFENYHNEYPDDPLVGAYYANCVSLKGGQALDSFSMFGGGIKATKELDEICNKHPEDIEVRKLRADQSLRLPEAFFKRSATAITDYEYILKRYEENRRILPKKDLYEILFNLGKAYAQLDMEEEAKTTWKTLLDLTMDPKYTALVKKELDNQVLESKIADDPWSASKEDLIKEAVRLHDLAVGGNKKAAQKAYELFGIVYEENPDNPLIEGYYGSSLALTGKYSADPQTMFGNGIKGLQHLKNAVSTDPEHPVLRLLKGNLLFHLPESFFHQAEKASKDFKAVITAYEQDHSIMSEEQYWQVLYNLGVCYERLNSQLKAQKTWQRLLNETSDPTYRQLLSGKIKGVDVL